MISMSAKWPRLSSQIRIKVNGLTLISGVGTHQKEFYSTTASNRQFEIYNFEKSCIHHPIFSFVAIEMIQVEHIQIAINKSLF